MKHTRLFYNLVRVFDVLLKRLYFHLDSQNSHSCFSMAPPDNLQIGRIQRAVLITRNGGSTLASIAKFSS